VDARHGNQVWGEQYTRKLTDLLALQHDAVHDVSEQLRPRLTQPERRRLPAPATQNNAAYQAYLRGNYFWNLGPESGYKKSGPYFQQAIDLDPTFAVIHHHYAMYLVLLGRSEDSYPGIQGRFVFGLLWLRFNFSWGRICFFTRQYDRAIAQFRKTIDLDPNYELAHEWLGNT